MMIEVGGEGGEGATRADNQEAELADTL